MKKCGINNEEKISMSSKKKKRKKKKDVLKLVDEMGSHECFEWSQWQMFYEEINRLKVLTQSS